MKSKIIKRFIIMFFLFFAMSMPVAFTSGEVIPRNLIRVEKTLESPFLRLLLNADVRLHDVGEMVTIYVTDYAYADDLKWKELFFGDAETEVHDELVGEDLVQMRVFYPELEHAYSKGNIFTRYFAYEARLFIDYTNKDFSTWWDYAEKETQAQDILMSPDQAILAAQYWIDQLGEFIGWDGLSFAGCYSMPGVIDAYRYYEGFDSNAKGYYLVEFNRVLDGIAVAYDKSPYMDDLVADIYCDMLQLFIDDDGVNRVAGNYRNYIESRQEQLSISLEDAIEILEQNMDYAPFYSQDNTFVVSEIGLCYRLIQTLKTYDKDVQACTEARPVWRFASSVNRFSQEVFVMYIDAVTGEVLPW